MSKVLVLYYSAYGHIEALANAVAEGARETGAKVKAASRPMLPPVPVMMQIFPESFFDMVNRVGVSLSRRAC